MHYETNNLKPRTTGVTASCLELQCIGHLSTLMCSVSHVVLVHLYNDCFIHNYANIITCPPVIIITKMNVSNMMMGYCLLQSAMYNWQKVSAPELHMWSMFHRRRS